MRKELGLLNIICFIVALGFLGMAVVSVIASGDFLTIDNLFIITVSLVMALMFIVNPLSGRGMDNLFSTHPSTENRIAALQQLAHQMGHGGSAGFERRPGPAGPWSRQPSGPWGRQAGGPWGGLRG